jgi:hypothetical protein
MAFATAYADKDEQWSVIFSNEKTFGWDLLYLKWFYIYYFTYKYIYIQSRLLIF